MPDFTPKNHTIRRKLLFIALLTTCIVLLTSNIIFISLEYYLNRQAIEDKVDIIANIHTFQASVPLLENDYSTLQANLNVLFVDSNILRACMYNAKQLLIASHTLNSETICPQNWHEITPISSLNTYKHFPIIVQQQHFGSFYIEVANTELFERIKQFLIVSGIILLLALGSVWLLAGGLYSVVLQPIRDLSLTLRSIMQKKDYSIRADNQHANELGELTELFNALLATIEHDSSSLKDSEERFRKLTALAPVGIFQLDAHMNLLYANQRWFDVQQLDNQHAPLTETLKLVHTEDLKRMQPRWEALTKQEDSFSDEVRLIIQNKTVWIKLIISPIHDQHSNVTGYLGTATDITELKNAQLQMETLAFYDALTGLANRRLFRDRLEHAVLSCQRNNTTVALMFLDMDQFKKINDTLGHDAGDELLKTVAQRLKQCVRETDLVSRIGGDEFTILLMDIHQISDVVLVAEKLLKTLSAPILLHNQEITTSVSIGITLTPTDSNDANTLMKNADMAMYQAKEQGRNNFQFFSEEVNRTVIEHIELEKEIDAALLDNNEFTLVYQPKIDIFSFNIVGMETLLRWNHPVKGIIPPDRFIPIAEETGQILTIGRWVLEQACLQMSELLAENHLPNDAKIAVNLSARQFNDPQLLDIIRQVLEETKLPAANLELELTESTLIDDVEKAISIMQEIKKLGITIAIDDFGTGYSSLSYIKRFPIDVLKVDRSFVMDIPEDQNDMAITAAVIAMAHKLNLTVVAEGVETKEQMQFLHSNHCDEGQGYLFSRPLYLEQLKSFLKAYNPASLLNS